MAIYITHLHHLPHPPLCHHSHRTDPSFIPPLSLQPLPPHLKILKQDSFRTEQVFKLLMDQQVLTMFDKKEHVWKNLTQFSSCACVYTVVPSYP